MGESTVKKEWCPFRNDNTPCIKILRQNHQEKDKERKSADCFLHSYHSKAPSDASPRYRTSFEISLNAGCFEVRSSMKSSVSAESTCTPLD